jgi:hypothetical protein
MQIGVQGNFGVAVRPETKPCLLKLPAKLLMVEYLAVKDDDDIAVRTAERLIAGFEIENAQSRCAQRNLGRIKFTKAVWSAMDD